MPGRSTTASDIGDVVRVTVANGERVTDLVLPSRLPVAEILPEVAALCGALDAYEAHGGYALLHGDGRRLELDASFVAQGVADGSLLTLVNGIDLISPKVYDDVVEAVADAVDVTGAPWTAAAARTTTVLVSAILLALGALVLFLQQGGPAVSAVAGVAAVLLLIAGAVFARGRRDTLVAVVVLAGAPAYGAVSAYAALPGEPLTVPLVGAGLVMALLGAVATFVLPTRGWTFLTAVVLGAVGATVGGVLSLTRIDPPKAIAVVLVVAVILASLIPWFAMSSARAIPDPMTAEADIEAPPDPIDPVAVQRSVRAAGEVSLGLSLAMAVLLTVTAPVVVRLGWPGLALVWAAGLTQAMRTRQALLARDVVVGLAGATAGLVSGTVAAVLAHPQWGGPLGALIAVLSVAVLAGLAAPGRGSVRWRRLLDVCEGVALFLLVPLLVLALGLLGSVRT
ncbi:MAG: type VII secretion integral membrane protein EccD [Actinomycetales bacterium]|nr:type VII secretion integral membrane protein EccD [Actinomycetales bacterium]